MKNLVPVKTSEDENDNFESCIKALPISSSFNNRMQEMLGSLMKSRNSVRIDQNETGEGGI